MQTADYFIEKLQLEKHPEGGYFREVYRSDELVAADALPERYNGNRNMATSIFFLLHGNDISSFHKIKSDETWHFYAGTTLELYILKEDGSIGRHLLGQDLQNEEKFQVTIPRNNWFGARLMQANSFALLGCTVAPGFHFDDFELANRSDLISVYPGHAQLIKDLTFE